MPVHPAAGASRPLTVSDWGTVFQGIGRERLSLKLSSLSTSCITVIAVRRFSNPFAKTGRIVLTGCRRIESAVSIDRRSGRLPSTSGPTCHRSIFPPPTYRFWVMWVRGSGWKSVEIAGPLVRSASTSDSSTAVTASELVRTRSPRRGETFGRVPSSSRHLSRSSSVPSTPAARTTLPASIEPTPSPFFHGCSKPTR